MKFNLVDYIGLLLIGVLMAYFITHKIVIILLAQLALSLLFVVAGTSNIKNKRVSGGTLLLNYLAIMMGLYLGLKALGELIHLIK